MGSPESKVRPMDEKLKQALDWYRAQIRFNHCGTRYAEEQQARAAVERLFRELKE